MHLGICLYPLLPTLVPTNTLNPVWDGFPRWGDGETLAHFLRQQFIFQRFMTPFGRTGYSLHHTPRDPVSCLWYQKYFMALTCFHVFLHLLEGKSRRTKNCGVFVFAFSGPIKVSLSLKLVNDWKKYTGILNKWMKQMPVTPLWNVIYLSVGAPYLSGITQNYGFGSLCCFPFSDRSR